MFTKEKHRLELFREDQTVFLVTHDSTFIDPLNDNRLKNEILTAWEVELKSYLSQNQMEWNLSQGLELRSYSFPALEEVSEEVPEHYRTELFNGSPFSIIFCKVTRVDDSVSTEVMGHGKPNDPGKEDNNPKDTEDQEEKGKRRETNEERAARKIELLNFIMQLDEEREKLSFAGMNTQGVFPNWISSSNASDSGGTGGPGGKPVPYTEDTDHPPFYFEKLIHQLQRGNINGTDLYGDGSGVDVVILDTAPPASDLVLAHKELVLAPEKESKSGHPLIRKLLGPSGRLKLYPATYEEHIRMGNTSLNRHGYKMTDHGLFIAGIIHSIVPHATIHLIEVLNQFGVGDLETITSGLGKAYAIYRQNRGRVVINCSLCLDVPDVLYEETPEETISDVERELEGKIRSHMGLDQAISESNPTSSRAADDVRWVIALRAICERLGKAGRQVIAAAGNDSKKKPDGARNAKGARYPAAFSKVVGVGSLPKNAVPDTNDKYEASSFSNLADKPAQTGIMALGGEPGAGEGVLGLFLGEFPPHSGKEAGSTFNSDSDSTAPDTEQRPESEVGESGNTQPASGHTKREFGWDKTGPKSENGWAWWAGTSFATPVLAAAIASVLSKPGGPVTTHGALKILYRDCVIENAITEKGEDGMPSSIEQTIAPPNWP